MKKLFHYFTILGLLIATPVFAATLNGTIRLEDLNIEGLEIQEESLGFQGNIAQPFTITTPSTNTAATTTNLFGNFLPQVDLAYDIGNSVSARWRAGYFNFVSSTTSTVGTAHFPDVDLGANIGSATLRFGVGNFGSVSSTSSTISNVYLGDGTESAPSLSFTSQNNLGLYRLVTGTMAFTTNGELIQSWMTTSTAIWNGGLSDYLNISFTGADTYFDTITGDIVFTPGGTDVVVPDDLSLAFGTGINARFIYETADSNANALLLVMERASAVDVPVFIIASTTAINVDLGLFDTWATPSLAVLSPDNTKYLSFRGGNTNPMIDTNATSLLASSGAATALWSSARFQVQDDKFLSLGTGSDAQFIWETADANANALILQLSRNGAGTTVPVFAVASTSANNVDLGLFDTWTNPTFAILGTANARYLRLYNNDIDSILDVSAGTLQVQIASSTVVSVSSTGIGLINGTVANPSLTFRNDTDKGLYIDTTSSTLNIVADGNVGFVVSSTGASVIDSAYLAVGTGVDGRFKWNVADANANEMLLVLPEGDATNVPVFIITDASGDIDLSFFDGVTVPTVAILDDTANDYLSLSFSGSDALIRTRLGDIILRPLGNDVIIEDSREMSFGTTADASFIWEDADANANELLLTFPAGGGTDVPVLALADSSAQNLDLGFFNGLTQPTLAVVDRNNGRYLRFYNNSIDSIIDTNAGRIRLQVASSTEMIVETNGVGYPMVATTTLSVAHSVTTTGRIMRLQGDGGATTITSTPSIQAGFDGQIVTFVGVSDTNTITFQDNANLAASGLRLSADTNFTLGLSDQITLIYDNVAQVWLEQNRSGN